MVPLLVDGNSLYARSYFRAVDLEFEDVVNGSVYLFLQSMASILNPISGKLPDKPTHTLFCFDGQAKRDKGRAQKPPEYMDGLGIAKFLAQECFGAAIALPAGEADDAVATAAKRLEIQPGISTIYVASGDKDLQQLANNVVCYYSLNEKSILGWSAICNKWRVKHPSHVALALAILGDAGDKIQGIKGWGPKKVAKLFEPISADTPLIEVAEHITKAMSPAQLATFEECLDLTLLKSDIPDVPDPAPIVIGGKDHLVTYGLANIAPQLDSLELHYGDTPILQANLDLD